ncbi:MAG: VOC family protein [Candidatus Heimdallarchaeota archaeon]|nr:VOC family protein [Candidatus Heimdallarchaeota archaeon]
MSEKKDNPIVFSRMYFQLKVKGLERAKKFYEDIFNFKVSWYMSPEAGWCELDLPGGTSKLGLNTIEESEDLQPSSGTFTIAVENLEETKEYLDGKGVKTTDIVDIPQMVSYFNLTDSEGNSVQIVADPRVTE